MSRCEARCGHCRQPISLQYPLVEAATALVFLMTYDTFFVARQRLGIGVLAVDWPMLLAHWSLWAGMIALAVMDLEAYMVDIRVTWVLAGVGLLAHMMWTPESSRDWIRPDVPGAATGLAVAVGLAFGMLFLLRRPLAQPQGEPIQVVEATQVSETDLPRIVAMTGMSPGALDLRDPAGRICCGLLDRAALGRSPAC